MCLDDYEPEPILCQKCKKNTGAAVNPNVEMFGVGGARQRGEEISHELLALLCKECYHEFKNRLNEWLTQIEKKVIVCPTCKGTARITQTVGGITVRSMCPDCVGKGEVEVSAL